MAISLESAQCGNMEESIEHAFFHSPVNEVLEGWMVRVQHGIFFVQEASFTCYNVVSLLNRKERSVFLSLLGVVIWTTRQKRFHGESFSFQILRNFTNTKSKLKFYLRDTLLFGIWLKVDESCPFMSRERY